MHKYILITLVEKMWSENGNSKKLFATYETEHDLCDKQEAQDVSFPRSLREQELKGTCLGLNRGISLSVAVSHPNL